MKFLILLFTQIIFAQTQTYTVSVDDFNNPERGFYKYTTAHSTGAYGLLTTAQLQGYRTQKLNLIWRNYVLDAFKTSDISAVYLSNMQTEFNRMRVAGVKCIVRFEYGSNADALKPQILSHIDQLKPVLLANEDVISSLEAGFIGRYGEWYYSDNYGTDPLSAQNLLDRREIGLKIMELCPNRMVAFRTPTIQRQIAGNSPIISANAYNGSILSRTASHNDCFLSNATDYGTYINTTTDYVYLENQSKYTLDGGEACAVSTFSECTNAIATMEQFHFNYLNIDYNNLVHNYWQTNGCLDEIKRNLGYRFELIDSSIASNTLTVNLQNVGYSNIFNDRKVYLVLRNTVTNAEFQFLINTDIKRWQSGTITQLTHSLSLPVPSGQYSLFLNMPDNTLTSSLYSIQVANAGLWESSTGYNKLNQTLNVNSSVCAVSTTWNGITWSNGAPNEFVNAFIDSNYTVNTPPMVSFKCCNLTINSGNTLTITSGKYVSVVNDLTNNGNLIVNNRASLVQVSNSGIVTNNGNTTVLRDTSPYQQYDYTFLSSPVSNTTIGAVLGAFPWYQARTFSWKPNYFYDTLKIDQFNTILASIPDGFDDYSPWAWNLSAQTEVMSVGRGYISMALNSGVTSIQYKGLLNNGIVTVPLEMSGNNSDNNEDWNLIGNPYPSAIFADLFINSNLDITGTLYFWTHIDDISPLNPGNSVLNFTTDDYALYNLSGGLSSISGSPAPTGFIASTQGFFVEAINPTSIVFDNSLRNEGFPNTQFFRQTEKDRFYLNLKSEEGIESNQLVAYIRNSTLSEDRGYDGRMLVGSSYLKFYSFIEKDDKYKIQSRGDFDTNDVVFLGYEANLKGTFTISTYNLEGVFKDEAIYLYDRDLDIWWDLEKPYKFKSDSGVFDERFEIHYLPLESMNFKVIPNPTKNKCTIYFDNSKKEPIFVQDMLQRVVQCDIEQYDNKIIIHTENFEKGTYVIRIKNKPLKIVKDE